jgi:hypothetical protein
VVVHFGAVDVYAVRLKYSRQLVDRETRPRPHRRTDRSSHAPDLVLEPPKPRQDKTDQHPGSHGLDVLPGANRQAERGDHPDRRGRGEPDDCPARVEDRPGAKKADSGDDLCRESGRIAHPLAVRADGETHRQVHQHCRAHADQDVRPQAGWLARNLALEADSAPEQHGHDQLEQKVEPERSDDLAERRQRLLNGGECEGQDDAGSRPRALSLLEVAHVVESRVRRRIAVRDAARLLLELRDSRFVGLGGGGELAEHGAAALVAGHVRGRRCLLVEFLLAAREAYESDHAAWPAIVHHISLESKRDPRAMQEPCGEPVSARVGEPLQRQTGSRLKMRRHGRAR